MIKTKIVLGKKITEVRYMTKKEMEDEGWNKFDDPPIVLILENGIKIFPSSDYECNSPGALLGNYKGISFYILPEVSMEETNIITKAKKT